MKHAESSALFPWMCQMSPRSTNTYSSLLIALGIWMNKNFLLLTRETKAEKPLEKRGPLCDLKDRNISLSAGTWAAPSLVSSVLSPQKWRPDLWLQSLFQAPTLDLFSTELTKQKKKNFYLQKPLP